MTNNLDPIENTATASLVVVQAPTGDPSPADSHAALAGPTIEQVAVSPVIEIPPKKPVKGRPFSKKEPGIVAQVSSLLMVTMRLGLNDMEMLPEKTKSLKGVPYYPVDEDGVARETQYINFQDLLNPKTSEIKPSAAALKKAEKAALKATKEGKEVKPVKTKYRGRGAVLDAIETAYRYLEDVNSLNLSMLGTEAQQRDHLASVLNDICAEVKNAIPFGLGHEFTQMTVDENGYASTVTSLTIDDLITVTGWVSKVTPDTTDLDDSTLPTLYLVVNISFSNAAMYTNEDTLKTVTGLTSLGSRLKTENKISLLAGVTMQSSLLSTEKWQELLSTLTSTDNEKYGFDLYGRTELCTDVFNNGWAPQLDLAATHLFTDLGDMLLIKDC
jgi:hypothetical protein